VEISWVITQDVSEDLILFSSVYICDKPARFEKDTRLFTHFIQVLPMTWGQLLAQQFSYHSIIKFIIPINMNNRFRLTLKNHACLMVGTVCH